MTRVRTETLPQGGEHRAEAGWTGVAARGGLWLAITMVLSRTSGFLVSVILARLMAPEQFGLLGMANVALSAIAMASELGLGAALVQRRRGRDFERAASTVFWTNVAFGGALVALNALAAPLVALYFHNPVVTPILRVMGLQFATNAFGAVHHSLLARELDYRRKLLPDVLPGMVNGAVAIICAWHGWGVWSLVAGAQLGALVGVASVWHVCRWRPRWIWDRLIAASLMRYGRHIVGAELLRFVTLNVDYLLVGRLFGPAALGVYTLAFNLANLVVTNAGFLFARVAFPLFSRLQDDPDRLQEAYLRMVRYLALIALPLLCGLCLLAGEFVAVIYGPRWAAAVAPLRVLTVLGAARALATLGGDVVRALGRPDVLSRLGLVAAPLTAAGVFVGASFGLTGVAAGETLVTILTAALLIRAALALLRLDAWRLGCRVAPIARAAAVMAAAVLLLAHGLALAGAAPVARLIAATTSGALLFAIALGSERATVLDEARRLMASAGWAKREGAGHAC